jgi:hypothetical protein
MPRGRLTFRQRDVAALIRALRQAGLRVVNVRLTPEGEVFATTSEGQAELTPKKNPMDKY